jgi:hypothetical protein
MDVTIQQVWRDVEGVVAVCLAAGNLIHWIKFCSRLTLNLRVLLMTIPFSRISRPTRRCPTSMPTSCSASVSLGRP